MEHTIESWAKEFSTTISPFVRVVCGHREEIRYQTKYSKKPFYRSWHENGNLWYEFYGRNLKLDDFNLLEKQDLHKENEPADIRYDKKCRIYFLMYFKNGMIHRENGPALIRFHKNGTVELMHYYINGIKYRENGPNDVSFYRSGCNIIMFYLVEYKLHRNDGPAVIRYKDDVVIVEYWEDGMRHRENGPAIIEYNKNEEIINVEYFIRGILQDKNFIITTIFCFLIDFININSILIPIANAKNGTYNRVLD